MQRRCYWLLESEDGTVLVHYLNVLHVPVRGRQARPLRAGRLSSRLESWARAMPCLAALHSCRGLASDHAGLQSRLLPVQGAKTQPQRQVPSPEPSQKQQHLFGNGNAASPRGPGPEQQLTRSLHRPAQIAVGPAETLQAQCAASWQQSCPADGALHLTNARTTNIARLGRLHLVLSCKPAGMWGEHACQYSASCRASQQRLAFQAELCTCTGLRCTHLWRATGLHSLPI